MGCSKGHSQVLHNASGECVLSALLLFNITQQIVFAYVIAVVAFTSLLPKQSFQIISSENLMLFFSPLSVCINYKD